MLDFRVNKVKKTLTFEFRDFHTGKIKFSETFDFITSMQIAADIMKTMKGIKKEKEPDLTNYVN